MDIDSELKISLNVSSRGNSDEGHKVQASYQHDSTTHSHIPNV